MQLDIRLEHESLWLTQAQIAELFQVKPQNITMHLKNVFADEELQEAASCKDFLQVQLEGERCWVQKNSNVLNHGLIQAYSRTNRIYDATKTFCNIVTFRDLEKQPLMPSSCLAIKTPKTWCWKRAIRNTCKALSMW